MKVFNKNKKIAIFIIMTVFILTAVSCTNSSKSEEQLLKKNQDTEFESDSRIRIEELSNIEQQNLHTLAKVWGFAKYRHPDITGGNINWDAELFRVMPEVLKVESREEAGEIMAKWLNQFPFEVTELDKKQEKIYLQAEEDAYLECDFSWISNREVLGNKLAEYLEELSAVKVTNTENSYAVFDSSGIVNVSEDAFMEDSMNYDDAGMRLLGLFRYWNIVEYFYPYKDIMDENWNQVLYDKIPELALGKSKESYVLSIANLTTYLHDSHGFFFDDFRVLERHFGKYIPEASFLNIEGQIVITAVGEQTPLNQGDIIVSVNGISIENRIEECRKYISVSDGNRFINAFYKYLLRSDEEVAVIEVIRNGEKLSLHVPCNYKAKSIGVNGKSGLMEGKKLGYLNLEELGNGDFDKLMKRFKNTEGLIVDVRNGPPTFVNYKLAEYIKPNPSQYAQFYESNIFEPGSFYKTAGQMSGRGYIEELLDSGMNPIIFSKISNNGIIRTLRGRVKERYQYDGKVILLMNECTQSHLETTIMSLRSAPNAVVIGSHSAGANGDVMGITLPGGIKTYMSGLAVANMDGSQVQRVGLKPDVIVNPTVKGIAEGKDELVEKAIEVILE